MMCDFALGLQSCITVRRIVITLLRQVLAIAVVRTRACLLGRCVFVRTASKQRE